MNAKHPRDSGREGGPGRTRAPHLAALTILNRWFVPACSAVTAMCTRRFCSSMFQAWSERKTLRTNIPVAKDQKPQIASTKK